MKKSYLFFLLAACIACNTTESTEENAQDSLITDHPLPSDSLALAPEAPLVAPDSLLRLANHSVLESIKKQDYAALAAMIHPELGLRFSPYATVNKSNDILISQADFMNKVNSSELLSWGQYDGSGDPIKLSVGDYFGKFVYDVDFLEAEKVSINSSLAKGNIMNNIQRVYPGSFYVENYFSGFDPVFQGMDWRALRLVFKQEGNTYFLIALVHDQWTT